MINEITYSGKFILGLLLHVPIFFKLIVNIFILQVIILSF
jgi:hypothetical protein